MSRSRSPRVARLVDKTGHVAGPFLQLPRPSPVAKRRDIARAHARLWRADQRGDVDDFEPKSATILGMPVSFFNWNILHFLFDEIFVRSCYAFKPPQPKLTIIDAGGNIGLASLWFARAFPEARITTIEPDPNTFAMLATNLERNTGVARSQSRRRWRDRRAPSS